MSKTEKTSEEVTDVKQWVEGTTVFTQIAFTRNLGNFESVKLTNGLGRPLKTGEHPKDAFASLYDQVTDALSAQVEDTKKQLG